MDVTILKVDFPNSTFNAPFAGVGPSSSSSESETGPPISGGSVTADAEQGGSPVIAAVVLLGLIVIAYLVRRFFRSAPDEGADTQGF